MFGEIWAILGAIWAKMVLEVPYAQWIAAFFLFLKSFLFGQVCGNLGKNSSHPQKFACSYTCVWHLLKISHWT